MLFGHGLASVGMGLFPAMFHVEHLLPLFRSTSAPLNRSLRRHLLTAWLVLPFWEVAPPLFRELALRQSLPCLDLFPLYRPFRR